jgi:anti-anti-sigma regulatory factor
VSPSISLAISKRNGVTVVALQSECDRLSMYSLTNADEVLAAAENAAPPLIVFDLLKTSSVTSTFLMFLTRVWRRLKPCENARFALSGLTPHCAYAIKATHLDSVWETFHTIDEAIESLSSDAK